MGKMFDDLKNFFSHKETMQDDNLFPMNADETIIDSSDDAFIDYLSYMPGMSSSSLK